MSKSVLIAVTSLAVGLGGGYLLFSGGLATEGGMPDMQQCVGGEQQREPIFYRNPMNPAVTSPVPAKDHMGMDYIPVYAEEETGPVGTVRIDPVTRHNIGLRTTVVERKPMSRAIRAPGRVTYDEESLVRLHPKVEGWIQEVYIDRTGQGIEYDDILLSIYSPKLVATQQEYLLALKNLATLRDSPFDDIREGARRLAASARERLTLLDVPEHQIVELEESREVKEGLHIHAPAGGTLLQVGARQGQYVTPATELYLIADLSTVWVYADIYEYELPWVAAGDRVEMSLASAPGRTFVGSLDYVFPYAEPRTRTTKVRLVFDNTDRVLRPEMFAEVTIFAAEKPDQLVIPVESVIRSGDYNQVFVVNAKGGFEPRRVTLGVESQGEVAISSGLSAGERVVASAQFLVDSESSLRAATARMTEPDVQGGSGRMDAGKSHSSADHGAMDHGSMNHGAMDHDDHEMHREAPPATHGGHAHD
ncbi:MAG: efflux RND transporter periplasmic adaptor subunit [Halioglobus sp.]|nr:efflux RND transporter periplasmic adaptor subunit [Halioglobus sp.]